MCILVLSKVFKLLSRSAKSGKKATQTRELLIPAELDISSNIVEQDIEERKERADRKRLLIEGLEGLAADEEEAKRREMLFGRGVNDDLDRSRFRRTRQQQRGGKSGQFKAPTLQLASLREFEPNTNQFGRPGSSRPPGRGGGNGRGRGGRGTSFHS